MGFIGKSLAQAVAIAAISGVGVIGSHVIYGPPDRKYHCARETLKPGEICLVDVPAGVPVLWVDARTRAEWSKNGLKNSVLWSLESSEDTKVFEADVAQRIMEIPRVIVYCSGEDCSLSHEVAERIRKLELGADVSVLKGGWHALNGAGMIRQR